MMGLFMISTIYLQRGSGKQMDDIYGWGLGMNISFGQKGKWGNR
jgi:hypothetical protein